jgi:hypothetical protein
MGGGMADGEQRMEEHFGGSKPWLAAFDGCDSLSSSTQLLRHLSVTCIDDGNRSSALLLSASIYISTKEIGMALQAACCRLLGQGSERLRWRLDRPSRYGSVQNMKFLGNW